ncbi:phage major capsid protein [Labrys sp. 22185]|uniref:phage major capsid protein n=1 Tax=Labrys sp. 22185 TaxID=3453888 RepID=UPI003F865F19
MEIRSEVGSDALAASWEALSRAVEGFTKEDSAALARFIEERAAPLETRSDDGNADLAAVTRAVEEFRTSAEAFQTRHTDEQKKLADTLDKRMSALEVRLNRPGHQEQRQDETPIEQRAYGRFLAHGRAALEPEEIRALTVATDATAGYVLAPEEISKEFIKNLVEFSPIRTVADVRSTGSHTVVLPKRLSITNAKWKGETVASEGSEPTFGTDEIEMFTLKTHVDLSTQLLRDSVNNPIALVNEALAEDFGQKEGLAFLKGSTAGQPEGFMSNADVGISLNGHATNLSADALIKMKYGLQAAYRNRGTWIMNANTLAVLRTLKDGAGNYLWQPSYQAGQPETILGSPVLEAVDMDDIAANAFPIAFGDFKSGYRVYDRVALETFSNPFLLATEGLVRIHAQRRVGAKVIRPAAIRKLKMATA